MDRAPTPVKLSIACALLAGGIAGVVLGLLYAGRGVSGLWPLLVLALCVPIYVAANHGWMSTTDGAAAWYLKRMIPSFLIPLLVSGALAIGLT